MTVIVPHKKTKQEVIDIVNRGADDLFASKGLGSVQIVDQKKEWTDSTMTFSFRGKMGFMSVPLSGTVEVNDDNVVINCELPGMLKSLIGEQKAQAAVSNKVKALLA
jgi:hypothetical protein